MKEKNWIKTYIFDLLPLLTAMVYVVAILYNKAYFSVFGFNVINYISLSDMLMSVIELFIYVVVAIIIFVSVLYFETKLLYSILYSIIKRRKRGEAYLRLEKMNYSQCSKEIHIVLFSLFLIICLFYYFIFIHNKQPVDANSGLINAAKALSFPPLVFSFVISPIYIFLGKNAFIEKINNISSYKVISAIFIFSLCFARYV